MTRHIPFLYLFLLFCSFILQSDFISEQKRYPRVRAAWQEKQGFLDSLLLTQNLDKSNLEIMLLAYKEQDLIEVWAKNREQASYQLFHTYPICARSGSLGPKVRQGDGQVPEGFYHIDRFNPVSNFHLSLGINYPNSADRRRNPGGNWGGDIFIHGSCVTVGCLPVTDPMIKEIYLLAVHAFGNGQTKIPVYIFPFRMTDTNLKHYLEQHQEHTPFWNNLKTGYDLFQKHRKLLQVSIGPKGDYLFAH